ncbi:MAG: GxxExxY protein [Bacteroidales bacterium]|nr:GxxExxY protein [Bacteroidales bacterium]
MKNNLLHSDITDIIIKAFYNVYNELGYGFLEKVYENAMMIELSELGLISINQQSTKVFYKGNEVGFYVADINVENKVIVELKAVETIAPVHEVVLVNYLKATGVEVGLLLNFGPKPKIIRKILTNDYFDEK